ERLDRVRHLHHGDWRDWTGRGADYRHHHLFRAAADHGRPRQPLPDDAGCGRDRGDAVCAQRHLGLHRRALRLAAAAAGAALALCRAAAHNLTTRETPNWRDEMAAKSDKVIITCAVTGAIHTPTMSDALPVTPDQIAAQ